MRDGLEIRARVQTKIPKTMKNYAYMAELASNFEGLVPRPLSVISLANREKKLDFH